MHDEHPSRTAGATSRWPVLPLVTRQRVLARSLRSDEQEARLRANWTYRLQMGVLLTGVGIAFGSLVILLESAR